MTTVLSSGGRLLPAAALTTVWTPPCGWVEEWWHPPASCWPPGWREYWYSKDLGYYSPAICPSAYTPGCSRFAYLQGPEPLPGETAFLCVPR